MRDVVVWAGPTNFWEVGPDATLPDAHHITVECLGNRYPLCPKIGDDFEDADGRRLPSLLARKRLTEGEVGDIVLASFSAGGSVLKRVLLDERDRQRIAAVHLADATYTSEWEDATSRRPVPMEGFVRYAIDAIDGPHMLIATASPRPNGRWATGHENLRRTREEVEARTGRQFVDLDVERDGFFGVDPKPDRAYRLGNVILAEFPEIPLGHNGHHTKLAGPVWNKIIKPWLPKRFAPAPTPPPGQHGRPVPLVPGLDAVSAAALFGVGVALGYGMMHLLTRSR